MKIKFIMLALCFSLILATSSCKNVESERSGSIHFGVSDPSVNCYYSNVFSKNKKQEIILAYWDIVPRSSNLALSGGFSSDPTNITCSVTRSNPTVKIQYVGKFDKKTGKGTVNIAGKTFDVSNGRLFLINLYEKPLKVIQVNEQFNLPPFNNLSSLDDLSRLNPFLTGEQRFKLLTKFKYLAKNNKIVAAFLADSKKSSDSSKNKSKDKKKDN